MSPPQPQPLSMSPAQEGARYVAGIRLFNERRFFEAHEAWEDAWHAARGVRRDFYQGLIQCAVALEHYRRSNPRGVVRMSERYPRRFRDVPPVYLGLDVTRFLAAMSEALHPVTAADPIPERGAIELDPARAPVIELRDEAPAGGTGENGLHVGEPPAGR